MACTRSIRNDRIDKLYKALVIEFIRLSVELHISKYIIFSGVRVIRSLVLCVWFVDMVVVFPFVLFLLAILLSVLQRYTDSDYSVMYWLA